MVSDIEIVFGFVWNSDNQLYYYSFEESAFCFISY